MKATQKAKEATALSDAKNESATRACEKVPAAEAAVEAAEAANNSADLASAKALHLAAAASLFSSSSTTCASTPVSTNATRTHRQIVSSQARCWWWQTVWQPLACAVLFSRSRGARRRRKHVLFLGVFFACGHHGQEPTPSTQRVVP